jgi:Rieske Fe-S protein
MSEQGPIDPPARSDDPRGATRRDLLDVAIAGGAALLCGSTLYPVVRFVSAEPLLSTASSAFEVVVAKSTEVPRGSAIAFRFGEKPALLARDAGGRLHAFIALCTHLGCVVKFREDLGHIWCACHGGHFDLTGVNILGPPPRPLDRLDVELRGDDVVVRKVSA